MNQHLRSRIRTSCYWAGGPANSTLEEEDERDLASAPEEAPEEGTRGRHFDTSIASCPTCSIGVFAGALTIKS